MTIRNFSVSPKSIGAMAIALVQPDASVIRPTVIVRAQLLRASGGVLSVQLAELSRQSFDAPATANGAGARLLGVARVPGALSYQVECAAADVQAILLQEGPYEALAAPVQWITYTPTAGVGGNNDTAEFSVNPIGAGAFAAGIQQTDGSLFNATVQIDAWVEDRYVQIDQKRFAGPGLGGPGSRIVALASVPGAGKYRVSATSGDPVTKALGLIGSFQNVQSPIAWLDNGAPPPVVVVNQPITYVWLATNGDDITGERGNIDRPFATPAAAMAAASDGDTIIVAPGVYPGPGDISAVGKSLTWEGTSNLTTAFTSGTQVFFCAPAAPAQEIASYTVRNIALLGGATAVEFDGAGVAGGFFLGSGLRLEGCRVGGAVQVLAAVRVDFVDLRCNDIVALRNVASGQVVNPDFNTFTVDFQGASPQVAGNPRNPILVEGGKINTFVPGGACAVQFVGSPAVGDYFSVGLSCYYDGGTGQDIAPSLVGALALGTPAATATVNVSLPAPLAFPATAQPVFDHSGSTIYTSPATGVGISGPAGLGAQLQAKLIGCSFPLFSATPSIQAGNRIDLDLSGSTVQDIALSVAGSGTIDTSERFTQGAAPLVVGANLIPISPPFPAGVGYTPVFLPKGPGIDPVYSALTSSGFTVTAAAVSAAVPQFTLIRNR